LVTNVNLVHAYIEQSVCAWNLTHAIHGIDARASVVDHAVRTVATSLTHGRFHTVRFQMLTFAAGLDAARVLQTISTLYWK